MRRGRSDPSRPSRPSRPPTPRPGYRGRYQGVYSALIEDSDFLALSPAARHVFLTIRLCPQNTRASLFRLHPGVLATHTGYTLGVLRRTVAELVTGRWIECEGPWESLSGPVLVWIRNGLRYDPSNPLGNVNHRTGIAYDLTAFGASPLVARFCDYYKIPMPSPMAYPTSFPSYSYSYSDSYSDSDSERKRKAPVLTREVDTSRARVATRGPERLSASRSGRSERRKAREATASREASSALWNGGAAAETDPRGVLVQPRRRRTRT